MLFGLSVLLKYRYFVIAMDKHLVIAFIIIYCACTKYRIVSFAIDLLL